MTERATILGIDPGTKRIGLAFADLETRFAHALDVLDAGPDAMRKIAEIAREKGAVKVVVGLPIDLAGREGRAVEQQRLFVERLRAHLDIPVEEFDERLTTVVAESALRAAGASAKSRKENRDAVAAQVLLQGFLDSMR